MYVLMHCRYQLILKVLFAYNKPQEPPAIICVHFSYSVLMGKWRITWYPLESIVFVMYCMDTLGPPERKVPLSSPAYWWRFWTGDLPVVTQKAIMGHLNFFSKPCSPFWMAYISLCITLNTITFIRRLFVKGKEHFGLITPMLNQEHGF